MIKIISTQKLWKGADKYHKGRYIGAGKDVVYPGYSFYARHSDIVMKGVEMLLNGAYRCLFAIHNFQDKIDTKPFQEIGTMDIVVEIKKLRN